MRDTKQCISFNGTMKITPKKKGFKQFELTGKWVYYADAHVWMMMNHCFPEDVCEIVSHTVPERGE